MFETILSESVLGLSSRKKKKKFQIKLFGGLFLFQDQLATVFMPNKYSPAEIINR